MSVRIVTDSSACLPEGERAGHRIVVVPIDIAVDGHPRSDLTLDDIVRLQDLGADLSTGAPSPGSFLDAVDGTDEGDGVVIITVASTMSGCANSASMAARLSDRDVRVVDSGTAAGGHALVALAAAACAEAGGGLDDVVARASDVAGRIRLRAAAASLDALARSGRVPKSLAATTRRLGIRPMFEFRNGRPVVVVPSIGADRMCERLVSSCVSTGTPGACLRASVLHACDPDDAARVRDDLTRRWPRSEVIGSEFDASMVIHTGPGLVGVAWWWE
jgi:DegV family protein with EDD domain